MQDFSRKTTVQLEQWPMNFLFEKNTVKIPCQRRLRGNVKARRPDYESGLLNKRFISFYLAMVVVVAVKLPALTYTWYFNVNVLLQEEKVPLPTGLTKACPYVGSTYNA